MDALAPQFFAGPDDPHAAALTDPPPWQSALDRVRLIAEVPLPLEVELDRRIMSVRAILALAAGSVLKLTRSAGENIDIRVGGTLMGFGEIVILEDSAGVRITDFWGES